MSEEHKEKLPLEILMEKYIPVVAYPERFGISVAKVKKLIDEGKVRRAEFRVPGEYRRSLHCNYEEVLAAIEKEKES